MHPPSLLDILFIFVIVLLFWGPGRLQGLGKGIGEGIRNFRKGLHPDVPAERPKDPPSTPTR
jgi:sec-independent protein translocase protein TatA